MKTILIVEDDKMLNQGISFNFQMDGFKVLSAHTLAEAKALFLQADLLILDVNLPDGSGFDFCHLVRQSSQMPILMLTACDLELDMMTGFRSGADDYVTKPFNLNILRERVLALLRRCEYQHQRINTLKSGLFTLWFDTLSLTKEDVSIELTKQEYKLLKVLMSAPDVAMSRQQLLEALCEDGLYIEDHTLSVNINRLRQKLEDNPAKPKIIKTVYGVGYQWSMTHA